MAAEGGGAHTDKKVMVAIDGNECSYHTLMWVLRNLKEIIAESPLLIFTAQPPPYLSNTFSASLGTARIYFPVPPLILRQDSTSRIPIDKFPFFWVTAPDSINNVQQKNRKFSAALLEKAKSICSSEGVNAEIISEVGDPKQATCDAVQKWNITLLVLGGRGIGKIKRVFLGSVSNHCLQNAKCPVLAAKKPL